MLGGLLASSDAPVSPAAARLASTSFLAALPRCAACILVAATLFALLAVSFHFASSDASVDGACKRFCVSFASAMTTASGVHFVLHRSNLRSAKREGGPMAGEEKVGSTRWRRLGVHRLHREPTSPLLL